MKYILLIWRLLYYSGRSTIIKIPKQKFIFGSFGAIIAVLLLGKNFLYLEIKDSVYLGFHLIFAYLALVYVFYFIKNFAKYIRLWAEEAQWGEAILLLSSARKSVYNIINHPYDDKIYMNELKNICNSTSKYFGKCAGTNCCVSIKVPIQKGNTFEEIIVKNLVRDDNHRNRDTKEYERARHTIISNTAYSYIVSKVYEQKTAYYINNNISATTGYLSSSPKDKNGQLPYQSEFVVPIKPLVENLDIDVPSINGFFCIDSDRSNSFRNDKYERNLLFQISDILSTIIR